MSFIDDIRKKILNKKRQDALNEIKQNGTTYDGNAAKSVISSAGTLTLNSKTNSLIEQVKQTMEEINKSSNGDCDTLIEHVQSDGVKVYKIKNATKELSRIKEHTGFICETYGLKALYIRHLVGESFGITSEPMLIISADVKPDYYLLMREIYLYYSMKAGLDGFDFETQELFKKYMNSKNSIDTSKLKYNQLAAFKVALNRDNEATEFVMDIIRRKEGSANVIQKMKDGGAEI